MSLGEDAHTDDWINWLRQWSASDQWPCWELFNWANRDPEEVRSRIEEVIGTYQDILDAFDTALSLDELYRHMDAFEDCQRMAEKLWEDADIAIQSGPPRDGMA